MSSYGYRTNASNISLMTSRRRARNVKPQLSVVPFDGDVMVEDVERMDKSEAISTPSQTHSILLALTGMAMLVLVGYLIIQAIDLFWA